MKELTEDDGLKTNIEKSLLGIAGEYAVASELCRRGVYAQLTLGNRKKVDLLVDGSAALARLEVKTKQGGAWPGVKGIAPSDGLKFLVLVDLQDKGTGLKPDFYVIGPSEWRPFLEKKLKDSLVSGKVKINEDNMPLFQNGYKGTVIKPKEVSDFKDRWDKIEQAVGPTRD
jgi:hypothetical protein